MSTPAHPAIQLRHSSTKGRYLVAAQAIEAGHILWQERPIITCGSADDAAISTTALHSQAAASAPVPPVAASAEERVWSRLHATLSAHVSPTDLLLTLHALRRLRLFGQRSRCWTLLQQLQHSGDDGQADSTAASPFARRFQRIASVAQLVFQELQRELTDSSGASTISAASAPCVPTNPVDPSAAAAAQPVPIDAALIARFLGIVQLNAHRCAPLPSNTTDESTLPVSAAPSPVAMAGSSHGKGLSLQLSMLEHDCNPNVDFSSEWITEAQQPSCSGDADAEDALCLADEQLVGVGANGSTLLRASSARSTKHSLLLTLRTSRPVAAGESLSINYYPCRVRVAIRQAHLRNHYGFTCACSRCEGVDDTRAFHCCYPAVGADDRGGPAQGAAGVVPPSTRRCPGVMAPRGLGQSAVSFQCALCHRTLRTESHYRSVCEWEQKMRGPQGAAAAAIARAAAATADGPDAHLAATEAHHSDLSFPLSPHPSHYLYPRSLVAASTTLQ